MELLPCDQGRLEEHISGQACPCQTCRTQLVKGIDETTAPLVHVVLGVQYFEGNVVKSLEGEDVPLSTTRDLQTEALHNSDLQVPNIESIQTQDGTSKLTEQPQKENCASNNSEASNETDNDTVPLDSKTTQEFEKWLMARTRSFLLPGYFCYCNYPTWCGKILDYKGINQSMNLYNCSWGLTINNKDGSRKSLIQEFLGHATFSKRSGCCCRGIKVLREEFLVLAWGVRIPSRLLSILDNDQTACAPQIPNKAALIIGNGNCIRDSYDEEQGWKMEGIERPEKLIVHFIRHGHIIKDESTRDPALTSKGVQQVRFLREIFDRHDHITDIVCSPMTRTLTTALEVFAPTFVTRGIKVRALPDLQTVSGSPPGIGLNPSQLAKKFERFGNRLDLSEVVSGWNNKESGRWYSDTEYFTERVEDFSAWLQDDIGTKREIAVVTHSSVLNDLVPDKDSRWKPCKWRTYTFDAMGKVVETEDSRARELALQTKCVQDLERNW